MWDTVPSALPGRFSVFSGTKVFLRERHSLDCPRNPRSPGDTGGCWQNRRPTTSLVFLGILIDTNRSELRLPSDKLANLITLIQAWMGKKSCTRKELESLLGHLSHAATVIPQGRTFLCSLFSLLPLASLPCHNLRLNLSAKADIKWWGMFLSNWNGRSFFPVPIASIHVTSDASGCFGCGGFSIPHGWFQAQWPDRWRDTHITAKELLPVVIAAALWGDKWAGQCVCFNSDNMAVVDLLRSRTTKDTLVMHLLRCLSFYAAFYRFNFESRHIPGSQNTAADAISRDNVSLFSSLVPQATRVTIPQCVTTLLITRTPDWGSPAWTSLFIATLTKKLPIQLNQCTVQDGKDT